MWLLLTVSRSGVARSRYLRAGVTGADAGPDPFVSVTRRVLRDDGRNRRRGSADEAAEVLSTGGWAFWELMSRGAAPRKPFTSVMALDGARKCASSSSSFMVFLERRSSDVLRPSPLSSGSSVPARLVLNNSDDLLPGCSSGSSVAARRIRAKRRDDFRPALIGSIGVVGAAAVRGLGRTVLASIVCRLCSRMVGARGLTLGFATVSAMALGRLWAEAVAGWMDVGLSRSSFSRAVAVGLGCLVWPDSAVNAMHSSVRLLQMLSAFRRSCLSVTPLFIPSVLAPLEIGPGCPGAPIMDDKANASVAADSMALNTSELTTPFVLESADRSNGCVSRVNDALLLASTGGAPAPEPRFGDADMVVALVVAVGGRSSDVLDVVMADAAILPVSSSRWIRDFKSSNSSQTVDGAAVELDDSVPSTPGFVSAPC